MSFQVTTAFTNQYKSNILTLLQQNGAKLTGTVMRETQESEFSFFDRISQVSAQEITTRHGDTEYVNTPHDRRRLQLRDFDVADLIDDQDKVRMLADPTSPYAKNFAMALGRAEDDEIIRAYFAVAKSGKDGGTDVSFPSSQQIAVNYVESGAASNSGLTIAKLRQALQILESNEVNPDMEEIFIVVSPKQKQDLLRTTEVTSQDFNTVQALVDGKINTFMGFKFITSNRLSVDGSGHRRIPVYTRSGMLMTTGIDIEVKIDVLPTKRYSTQVYARATFGASRMEEERVVEIKCLEA